MNYFIFGYNDINHGVTVTCCYICCLITEAILLFWGYEWDKICICFINVWFFVPGFEYFVEKYGCVYIFVADVKKLDVIDYFIALF